MPNNKDIIIWSEGKINRINIDTKQITNIPFQINEKIKLAKTHHVKRKVFEPEFASKMIKDVKTSPDGKTIVFTSLGHIYKKTLPNGTPQRITSQNDDFEFEPSFSADGQRILALDAADSVAHYNQACSFSMLGNVESGLRALKRAVRTGYSDLAHLEADADLELLRSDLRYFDVLALFA